MSESQQETKEYQVLNEPIGDVQPGETIELAPQVAEAFADNLADPGEDRSDEGVRSQVVGGGRANTLATQDGPIEAGEYEVYRNAIGDVQPGETAHFEASVARAFADNLLAPDADADAGDTENTADVSSADSDSTAAEADAGSDANADADADDERADEDAAGVQSFDTPEAFLDQSIPNIEGALAEADLTDEQLQTLLDTEQEGEDRSGAKETIRERMDENSEDEQ